MADTKTLKLNIVGDSASGRKALQDVATESEATGSKIGGAFSSLFSKLGSINALGPLAEGFNILGEGADKLAEKHTSLTEKMAITGAGALGLGGILTAAGSHDKQAMDQLSQAITNTGGSYSDYKEEIEKTIKSQENYGNSAAATQNALQTLTQATGDPKKALEEMGTAANLAAAKHEDLSTASNQLAQILGGKGTKTLAQFGITVGKNADGTKDYQGAIDALSKKVDGQASASTDNWTSKLDVLKTKIEDNVASLGEKYGPAITTIGAGMTAMSGAAEIGSMVMSKLKGAQEATTIATEAQTAAQGELTAAATATDVAEGVALLPILLIIGAVAALGVGIYELASHWSQVWTFLENSALGAWRFIDGNVIQPIENFFGNFPNFASRAFSGLSSIISQPFKAAADGIAWAWNNTVGNLSFSIPSWVPDIGGNHFSLPKMPILDTGGIVTGPTLAALSVNSVPEAVIPLPRLNEMMNSAGAGSGGGTVIFEAGAIQSNANAHDIGAEVAWAYKTRPGGS